MLKGIDPILDGEVLHALDAMGHGDDVILCDTNFPAERLGRASVWGTLVKMPNVDLPRALDAVLAVLPIDTFVTDPVATMAVVDAPDARPDVHVEVESVLGRHAEGTTLHRLERFAFYARAEAAFCIIQTGERRFYGNVAIRKGVV